MSPYIPERMQAYDSIPGMTPKPEAKHQKTWAQDPEKPWITNPDWKKDYQKRWDALQIKQQDPNIPWEQRGSDEPTAAERNLMNEYRDKLVTNDPKTGPGWKFLDGARDYCHKIKSVDRSNPKTNSEYVRAIKHYAKQQFPGIEISHKDAVKLNESLYKYYTHSSYEVSTGEVQMYEEITAMVERFSAQADRVKIMPKRETRRARKARAQKTEPPRAGSARTGEVLKEGRGEIFRRGEFKEPGKARIPEVKVPKLWR